MQRRGHWGTGIETEKARGGQRFGDQRRERGGRLTSPVERAAGPQRQMEPGLFRLLPGHQHARSAKDAGGWQQYYERYIACGEQEYLRRVGGEQAVRDLALPVF